MKSYLNRHDRSACTHRMRIDKHRHCANFRGRLHVRQVGLDGVFGWRGESRIEQRGERLLRRQGEKIRAD